METLLICPDCKESYNEGDRSPKILPCSDSLCVMCLLKCNQQSLGGYNVLCTVCKKTHSVSSLDDIPTSKTTLYLLQQIEKSSVTNSTENKFNETVNKVILELNKEMKISRFNIQLHYDDAINNIDIRTETLINELHTARAQLQDKLNEDRKKSIDLFNNELDKLNSFEKLNPNQLHTQLNKIESNLAAINQKLYYFSDNNLMPFESSWIGHVVSKELDTNFKKIKSLKSIMKTQENQNNKQSLKVTFSLKDAFSENSIRQNVIPLSMNRILKVYFTVRRSIFLELYDSTGQCINQLNAFENLSSFPISCGFGNYFVLSFTSKTNSSAFFETNQSFILLYDIDFNLVKQLKKFSSVESVFMNDKYIILSYAHRAHACCSLFDYNLDEIESFGQQLNPERPFYMEKVVLSVKEQINSNLKSNPKIFGLTNENIYFQNLSRMIIMCRQKGEIKTESLINGDSPYFLLDSQNNILRINNISKRIALINYEFGYDLQNVYSDYLDEVCLTADNNLAFVDKYKESVLFI